MTNKDKQRFINEIIPKIWDTIKYIPPPEGNSLNLQELDYEDVEFCISSKINSYYPKLEYLFDSNEKIDINAMVDIINDLYSYIVNKELANLVKNGSANMGINKSGEIVYWIDK